MDNNIQPTTPMSAPNMNSKKNMMLWIIFVVLVAIIAAIWITNTSVNPHVSLPNSNSASLIDDVQGIDLNPVAPDFKSVDTDIESF